MVMRVIGRGPSSIVHLNEGDGSIMIEFADGSEPVHIPAPDVVHIAAAVLSWHGKKLEEDQFFFDDLNDELLAIEQGGGIK